MPWLTEAMKDVLGCEKVRRVAKRLWLEYIRMGQPNIVRTMLPFEEQTWGSETSQYPKEYKSIEILLVAASEQGLGLKHFLWKWNKLESLTIESDSLVHESY